MKQSTPLVLLFLSILCACSCAQTPAEPVQQKTTAPQPSETSPPTPSPDIPTSTLPPASPSTEPELEALLPDPRDIQFEASDGEILSGIYYPASINPAPLVILMHWFPGDQAEWTEIAFWLQNRGQESDLSGSPWLDSSWFPELSSDFSVGVFTFTFRNCSGGCKQPEPDLWLLDGQAALLKAVELPGVDPQQIIIIGASIGADAAADTCAWSTSQSMPACLGVLSLSPGNYLNTNYLENANTLEAFKTPRPVWCFYDENEEVADVCLEPDGDHYYHQGWANGNLHGMRMLNPDLDPNPLDQMLTFLAAVGIEP